jgi:hypothetical protein
MPGAVPRQGIAPGLPVHEPEPIQLEVGLEVYDLIVAGAIVAVA